MTTVAPPEISIVIATWNTRLLLRACLDSIEAAQAAGPRRRLETIVVDNASSDGTAGLVRTEFPWVRLVENERNAGFAGATNQGLRLAAGRYLLLLNPDTELRPGAIDSLAAVLDRSAEAGAAGACLLNPDGSLQASASPMPGLLREAWRLAHLDRLVPLAAYPLERWRMSGPRRVDVAQGACLLLRREALDQVGLLDEDYFMYTEEVDLCYRLSRAGWGVSWVPQAEVLHHGGQSTRQRRAEMFVHLYQSKILFFRKNRGGWAARAYKVILALAALPRLAAGLFGRSDPAEGRITASHYARLLRALPSL